MYFSQGSQVLKSMQSMGMGVHSSMVGLLGQNVVINGSARDSNLQEKINEIWREGPNINFPQCLIDKLDLPELRDDLQEKAEKLRTRIMARKGEEERKK